MATMMHNQLGLISADQFAALPPHLKLQHSELLANEIFMNHEPVPAQMARDLGFGNLTPIQVIQAMHGHTGLPRPVQPSAL